MGCANLCRGPELNWRHMVLQTIALPTELPRREPHSIGDARLRRSAKWRHGLDHHVSDHRAMVRGYEHDIDETIGLDRRVETPKPLSFRNHVPWVRGASEIVETWSITPCHDKRSRPRERNE